ncbi:MAG: AAA family ATPase [Lachnospiraceae bacterium]|nr:AAA family ATPase [Lachnospiraceae bacterium]
MITFNNSLDAAAQSVCQWCKKSLLSRVTIIRDVYGKLSFLMDNTESVADPDKQKLVTALCQELGPYFSGKIYWKKLSHTQRRIEEREKLIIEILEQERRDWINRDNIEFYLSERPIAKKAWVCQPTDQESVWTYDEAAGDNGKKVITFYSFKGGMGRTTALAAVALNLVRQGKNVMMVDTDIEAPGLATLFFDEELIGRGILDYMIEHEIDERVSITDYVLDVTDPALLDENEGQLFLMPAGRVDRNYLQKLARIDFQDNRAGYLREALVTLLNDIRENYDVDYILIDARAGFHDMGGVAVAQLPHGVVLFGNDSRQSWDGLTQVLRTIAEGHRADFPVMIVGAMCPKAASEGYTAVRNHFINKSYTICTENYYDAESEIPGVEAEGEIHFPELLSFNDELLQGVELYSDGSQEKNQRVNAYKTILTGESYKKIANRIKSWFGED